ncbi:hypothetical protein Tco_0335911 [Tanacetum coccineum]
MAQDPFDERYKLVPRKMSSLKAKQPKKPPPKRTRNVGKYKRTQLSTSYSTESPPSDNRDLPSTKLSARSYSRALKDDPNMSKEQRETRGIFKNLDISRNPSKEKGKKIASPSVTIASSSSSNDNEAPSFLEFYDELSDSEDLTKAQREKRGMFKCLNRYVGTITKYLEKQK